MKKLFLAMSLSAVLGACASMPDTPPAQNRYGMLTDTQGMTLYIFDKDAAGSGKSVCNGPCATNWPPLMASEKDQARGDWSIVGRDDGRRQWAYKGRPLYTWSKDQKPGDTTGDGFLNNQWHVARP
ncbi:hypothetical protein [Zoogloea sp.]|uniref:COG4315 family predicted lipoprotein n=1 Tax=Zoogloea sp. TaxID=49181 RepID=UPI0035B1D90B